MELTKHPETEMEYWEAIEGLGGYVWSTNHALSHGRIEDPNGEVEKSLTEARELQVRLANEITEKFGVILPKDCPQVKEGEEKPLPPEGKIFYWDWYSKMKQTSYSNEYEGMICSACPFSEGVEKMIGLGGQVPCSVFHGSINRLVKPYLCAMVYVKDWTDGDLLSYVKEKGGEEVLIKFEEKLALLKSIKSKV